MKYRVERYQPSYYSQWNDLVGRSKNGTFLFHRDFMEYHSDRFEDFSILIFKNDKPVAVLPANKEGDEVLSHWGLTYGGLILEDGYCLEEIEEMLAAILRYYNAVNIIKIIIKQIPSFYYQRATFEIEYLLPKVNAVLYRREMNLAIDFSKELLISRSKMKHFRRISGLGLEVRNDNNFELFWDKVLVPRLNERYNVNPVHTKEEIKFLHSRFPENILQYNVYSKDEIVAGITLFNFGNVVKSQYGATTKDGESLRALDYIFISLIKYYKDIVKFFDMGTVSENSGKSYNKGLLKQKQELGCSIFLHDFYEVETKNYYLLDNVLI